ncbi:MAG: energy-coupling factor transporter transmembrane component T family protein [Halanaerobiales bacterium]
MNVSIFLDKDTVIHRLDPRTKIFILLSMFVLALLSEHPLWGLCIWGIVVLYGFIAKSLKNLKQIWFVLVAIFIMSLVMWSLLAQGTEKLFWIVEKASILKGLGAGIQINAMIFAGMIFLSTTRIEDISVGLVKLGIPYKISFAFTSAVRLVPTFVGSGATISQAQKSRGLDLDEGSIIERMKKYIPLLVPIFLSALRDTDQLSMALESKGFGNSSERTSIQNIQFSKKDYLVLLIFIILIIAGIYLRVKGFGTISGLQ